MGAGGEPPRGGSGRAGESEGERARRFAELGLVAHRKGESERALERALAQSHNVLGVLASSRGDLDGALRHLERSLGLAKALGDPAARVAALNNLALAHGTGGQLEQALERAEAALDLCASLGDRHREAALHNNLADLLHAAGQKEESMRHLKKAVEIFAEVGEEGALQPGIWKQ